MKTLNKKHIAWANKTQILVACFNFLINALGDIKTKMLNFNTKMAVIVERQG